MTLARDVIRFGGYVPATEKSYAKIPQIMEMPNLIKVQLDSYEWFKNEGLRELLDEISPIQDFTGSKMELRFGEYSFGEPKYDERECRVAGACELCQLTMERTPRWMTRAERHRSILAVRPCCARNGGSVSPRVRR